MICLTGDVHQPLGSMDQRAARLNEVACALRYAEVGERCDLKATLFVTGRAAIKHEAELRELAGRENVRIEGHTYSAFQPRLLFRLLRFLGGAVYGPAWYQSWDIAHTVRLIERVTGRPCVAWRTHAFQSNRYTYAAAHAAGVQVISDEVTGPDVLFPRYRWGLLSLPINVLEDHTHLYHGLRTPEHVRRVRPKGGGRGIGVGPDPASYTPEEWAAIVTAQVEHITSRGGLATLLVHPICMHVADDFQTFERLCRALSRYGSIWAHEALTEYSVKRWDVHSKCNT